MPFLRQKGWFCGWPGHVKRHIPDSCPSPCGYVYLGAGTQQLGRSLPLSGCLACPGLEAIVIRYCSGRGKGRKGVLHAASRHPLFTPLPGLSLTFEHVFFFQWRRKKNLLKLTELPAYRKCHRLDFYWIVLILLCYVVFSLFNWTEICIAGREIYALAAVFAFSLLNVFSEIGDM